MSSGKHKIRFVTASALFDGHDVSITIMRRILQASGAEVIHLGHNRSVQEIVQAAIQEDVQGIAVSSYQGGHVEFFTYMMDLLREKGAAGIKVFGGGGGVILPSEIKRLHDYGVTRLFSPDDGRELGLQGMIAFMMKACDFCTVADLKQGGAVVEAGKDHKLLAKRITAAELACEAPEGSSFKGQNRLQAEVPACPVVGITGTGGAGKSSLTDEIVQRFLRQYPDKTIAILSVDPTKQRSGGALLGDRIRMNAVHSDRVYMRSMATRESGNELSAALIPAIQVLQEAGFDLVLIETSGIGQGDHRITKLADVSLYVMTSEFGAPSQLEKIDMLDYADLVAINKFDRRGSADALRDVQKQVQRNHGRFDEPYEAMPVYGTMASQFNDVGVDTLFAALIDTLNRKCALGWPVNRLPSAAHQKTHVIIPADRTRYLGEIVQTVRSYHAFSNQEAELASACYRIDGAIAALGQEQASGESLAALQALKLSYENRMHKDTLRMLTQWPERQKQYAGKSFVTRVRDKEIVTELTTTSLSGLDIPKISLPKFRDAGDIVRWLYRENVPGEFPYTAGVFPFKRTAEDPKRQFAGEGSPQRTNLRFHYLSQNDQAKRLSTAFDSVTLYGEDPDERQDIYGKIGESGVSICTLDDMKKLYAGFDLCDGMTSVSMTINGPAPIILAMYMNTAMDDQLARFTQSSGRAPTSLEAAEIRRTTLKSVRGTVQADILKEDQGQNTCIFSTEFALRMMGDIQQYFIDQEVRNYYSVSISGYHIAEAGANPISQLAFTLANGFTYVEYYLSRGMLIDDFAPNLSFFFSNGLDPEYTVIGRVARRIWAAAMKHKYGGNDRSQKLKYHIQTSGRSLHAQEMDFNDIRTTLQALMALLDNCNSLHTNSYDEAVTTPTEESVRRAMAIQLIITKELGFVKNENMLQGSFLIEELTDLVEEAVLQELERISDRGGVLGAMESQYQRGKIQNESMLYEMKKHQGDLPIIGVNTFLNPHPPEGAMNIPLARAALSEKDQQIVHLREFQERNHAAAPAALAKLQEAALSGGNIFAELMETVKVASLGQITRALYQVGGQYRRNM
ncbi:fused isobutyryl-CoA mutase/GTPase IcmF [Paenibacillus planticolens]|uniref:Fused isobutyryl-CoA mutase n=1 Tax=Paenibacillus planticolens TaxID=2654976 RepID=A0ABX1ZQZ7_9BACL|nr:fused isobutyryl-CoA mutase/GTPase IcmF [Paenibacillus planticolens]NOV02231.1 methylmalonyl-CoA mutase [Paenibacillus planticolens]